MVAYRRLSVGTVGATRCHLLCVAANASGRSYGIVPCHAPLARILFRFCGDVFLRLLRIQVFSSLETHLAQSLVGCNHIWLPSSRPCALHVAHVSPLFSSLVGKICRRPPQSRFTAGFWFLITFDVYIDCRISEPFAPPPPPCARTHRSLPRIWTCGLPACGTVALERRRRRSECAVSAASLNDETGNDQSPFINLSQSHLRRHGCELRHIESFRFSLTSRKQNSRCSWKKINGLYGPSREIRAKKRRKNTHKRRWSSAMADSVGVRA